MKTIPIILAAIFAFASCSQNVTVRTDSTHTAPSGEIRIKMATTTSTDNSGLLDVLLPAFEEKTGIKVDVIAVGTGAALEHGRNGDVDVVFVHSRPAEDQFIEEGYGVNRRDVMHNDFIILGPENDPAGISRANSVTDVFGMLSKSQIKFISRGDDSGTHKKELEIWSKAGLEPHGSWYLEAGQGMEAVITMADNERAYTLADRGTYLSMLDKTSLVVCYEGDPVLFNPYGVIAINPDMHEHVKYTEAMAFIAYVTSIEGQTVIWNFQVNGQPLFYPDAVKVLNQ